MVVVGLRVIEFRWNWVVSLDIKHRRFVIVIVHCLGRVLILEIVRLWVGVGAAVNLVRLRVALKHRVIELRVALKL